MAWIQNHWYMLAITIMYLCKYFISLWYLSDKLREGEQPRHRLPGSQRTTTKGAGANLLGSSNLSYLSGLDNVALRTSLVKGELGHLLPCTSSW